MDNLTYTQNLMIDGATETKGDRHGYKGTISSTSLNQQAFHISLETLRNIRDQANVGVPVHFNHQTYEFQAGKSTSATLNGEKVNAEFYILAGLDDINSDDVIKRMDEGVVDALSIGFMGGDFYCDLCEDEKMEFRDDGWWFVRACANGHVLGRMTKDGKKEKLVTAEVRGKVNLREFSVVNRGADPSAKMIKKLQSELSNGTLNETELTFIAETHNFNLNHLCETLGYDRTGGILLPKKPMYDAIWNHADAHIFGYPNKENNPCQKH